MRDEPKECLPRRLHGDLLPCKFEWGVPNFSFLNLLDSYRELLLRGFGQFSFLNFTFGFHGFYLKMFKKIQLIFELACGRKFSGEQ